jgi:5-methyltetrahydropteroyltriglutamate--homocysteine methyltransferase
MMTVEEYAYARARARRPVKVTLPSPLMLFLVWSPRRSRDAYSDPFELFADGLRLMREEAEELARMGCRYIQVDAPDFGQLVDPTQRDAWERAGISVDRVSGGSRAYDLIEALMLGAALGPATGAGLARLWAYAETFAPRDLAVCAGSAGALWLG